VFSEQKLLKKLIAQVGALSRSEKALLTWLIEHDGEKISAQHLADAVGMDRGVTWTRQTRKLVKLPFVARWGTNQFWYQAVFTDYVRRYFASVSDVCVLTQQLIKAAQ
jgi:hypothetical protein